MHELSTCRSIIHQAENSLSDHSSTSEGTQSSNQIKSITLRIGELARVDVDELVELFPLAAKDTVAHNAALIIKHEPVSYTCNKCHYIIVQKRTTSNTHCSQCGSDQLALSGGTDMLLDSIELVDN